MSVQRKPRENYSDNDKQLSDKKTFATTGKSSDYNKSKSSHLSHPTSHIRGTTPEWEARGWENARNLNSSNNRQLSNLQDIPGGGVVDSVQGSSYPNMDIWGRMSSDGGGRGGQSLGNSSSPRIDMSQWVFGGNKVEEVSPPALDLSEFPTLSSTVSSSVQEESNRAASHPSISPHLSGYYSAAVGANRTQPKGKTISNGKHADRSSFPSLNTNEESMEKWSHMEGRTGWSDNDWQRNLTSYSDPKVASHDGETSAAVVGSNSMPFDTTNLISSGDFGNNNSNVSSWMSSHFGTKSSKDISKHSNNSFEQSIANSESEAYHTNLEVISGADTSEFSHLSSKLSEISLPHDTMDVYGIRGLLKLMSPSWRTEQPDYLLLTLGIDLTSLGLNLNSTEPLYLSFETPFLDVDRGLYHEPEYNLPECYKMEQKPPLLKLGHFRKFQLQTLFYIFYCMPRDALQILAAAELYQRDWRYHKDLKLWFTRAPGTTTPGYERNAFIYFDITTWERKPFHETNRNFLQGFLPQNVITEAVEHLVNSNSSS